MITSMRNEAPYILEWIAYHKNIGVDGFLIYSNDCDDGTDVLLDRLDTMGIITHIRNDKITKAGVQWSALKRADKHPMKAQAEWILFADVDEFVNIKVGRGHLNDLLAAVPDATAFALMWQNFGNNGRVEIEDDLVLEQFTKCARLPCYVPLTGSMFKTLFKNDGSYEKLGIHRPKKRVQNDPSQIHWVNGSGHPLGERYVDNITFTYGALGGVDLACLNHYSLKSAKAFLAKTLRGLPNRSDKLIDLGYWVDRNFNNVEDVSIQRMLPVVEEYVYDLLKDADLNALHTEGLNWHKKSAETIIADSEGARLFSRIVSLTRSDLKPEVAIDLGRLMSRGFQAEKLRRDAEKNKKSS